MKFKPIWILHITVTLAIAALFVFQQTEYKDIYDEALDYADIGYYDMAYSRMKRIEQYRDASDKMTEYELEINYLTAYSAIEEQNWADALPILESITAKSQYKDAEDLKNLCIYEQAIDSAEIGELLEAERKFISLPLNFKDVSDRKQVIADNKKYKGTWTCTNNNLDLRTVVYVDENNIPRVNAEIIDHDALLLDEPITLKGDGLQIVGNKFSWELAEDVEYSFVYDSEQYTALKKPVVEGSTKLIFERASETDYDRLNSEYTTTEF